MPDGKVLRGVLSGNEGCSAVGHGLRYRKWLVAKPESNLEQEGEIETVKEMLDILELKGAVITLDAPHCQRETLQKNQREEGVMWWYR